MEFGEFEKLLSATFPAEMLPVDVIQRFRQMEQLYRDWNSRINVISRKDMDDFYHRHVFHSLCIASYLLRRGVPLRGLTFLDVGTGGGFPGIPLAVLCPQCSFVLCDSIAKKILVASSVASSLGLENVRTVCGRAEALDAAEKYDYVVSRAVTSLDKFLPWVKGKWTKGILYLKGGSMLPGGALAEELATAKHSKAFPAGGYADTWPLDGFDEKFVVALFSDK